MAEKNLTDMANDMMKSLQQQWDDTLAGKQEALKNLTETAKKNYETLKKQVGEGKDEAAEKLKKLNEEMLEKMKTLQDGVKDQLNTEYKKLVPDDNSAEKNLAEFKKKINESFSKSIGDKSSAAYKDAMSKLEKFQGKTKKECDAFYGDMMKSLDGMYEENVKKLKY